MILNKDTIEQICKELSLPYTGNEQDWDIELADSGRVDEFISYYKENNLSDEMKYGVMSVILASYDDYLDIKGIEWDDKWFEIRLMLLSGKQNFRDLIQYWSMNNEIDNVFRITPLIREVKGIL